MAGRSRARSPGTSGCSAAPCGPGPTPRASASATSASSPTTSCSSLLPDRGFQQSTVMYQTEAGEKIPTPQSVLGFTTPSEQAEYYRVVKRITAPHGGDPKGQQTRFMDDAKIKLNIEGLIDRKVTNSAVAILGSLEFAIRMVPVVGALDDFAQGKYLEGAISLAGDVAMLTGLGAALAARNCTYAGMRLIKFANIASASI